MSIELDAFDRLEDLNLLTPGEFYSQVKAKRGLYSQRLRQHERSHLFALQDSTKTGHDPIGRNGSRRPVRQRSAPDPLLDRAPVSSAPLQVVSNDPADLSSAQIREELTYQKLLDGILNSIRNQDQDEEMTLRAELMARFRRSDSQINADLFRLLTAQEGGTTGASYGSVDTSDLEPMHWLVDGFIPANDQVLMYGEAGSGKTSAAAELGFSVVNGTGLLDRSTPTKPGKVLFISSDSGLVPLMEVIDRCGYANHPALSDGRFTVWAFSKRDHRMAWDASISGCLALLKAIQDQGFSLVLIDSCKAVTTKADLEYTSNPQVTALLTFFQEVICQHCSVVWLNHDGTAKGAHAGAKAWREVPSMVHSIEKVEASHKPEGEAAGDRERLRWWKVRKCRMGTVREFQYELDSDAGLRLPPDGATPIVGDCSEMVLQLLQQAWLNGIAYLTTQALVDDCCSHGYSQKTVWNTLTNLKRRRDVTQPARGKYSLSPKKQQLLKGFHIEREGKASKPSEREGFDILPANLPREVPGRNVSPDLLSAKQLGRSEKPSQGVGSEVSPSREAWKPLGAPDFPAPPTPPATTTGNAPGLLIGTHHADAFTTGTAIDYLHQALGWQTGFAVASPPDGQNMLKVRSPNGSLFFTRLRSVRLASG